MINLDHTTAKLYYQKWKNLCHAEKKFDRIGSMRVQMFWSAECMKFLDSLAHTFSQKWSRFGQRSILCEPLSKGALTPSSLLAS